jgi:hypothetical protein
LIDGSISKIEIISRTGKYCRDLIKKPDILSKIHEFRQGVISKQDLEVFFKNQILALDVHKKRHL